MICPYHKHEIVMERSWKHHVCFFTRILTVLKIYVNLYKYRATASATWKIHGKNHPECRSRRPKQVLEKRRSFSAVRQPGVVTCNHLRRRAGQDEGWEGFQNPGTCELEVVVGFSSKQSHCLALFWYERYMLIVDVKTIESPFYW